MKVSEARVLFPIWSSRLQDTFLQQRTSHCQGVWSVDSQYLNRSSPNGGPTCQLHSIPTKMLPPTILSWLKQPGNPPFLRIYARNVFPAEPSPPGHSCGAGPPLENQTEVWTRRPV